MSLGVVIKGPEGIVLAADSRVTLEAKLGNGKSPPIMVNFDNATKLLSFSEPNSFVGAVTYGAAVIGQRTAHSYIPEFELTLEGQERLGVKEFSEKMSKFFMRIWKRDMPEDYHGPHMAFIIGGYDSGDAYGKVFLFEIPGNSKPEPRNPGEKDFGMTWGGQLQIASRLIHGYDPSLLAIAKQNLNLDDQQIKQLEQILREKIEFRIPYAVLPLQDCIDLATFLVRTTIIAQGLSVGVRGVGGPIEVAVVRRTKRLSYIQKKRLHGEAQYIERETSK